MFLIKQVLEENNIIPNNDSNNQSDDTEKKLNVKQVLDTKIKNKIDYENIIQSIVKYNDTNKIIEENAYKDLEIFEGIDMINNSIFQSINKTKTLCGRIYLKNKIKSPTTNINSLVAEQKIIKYLLKNPEICDKINALIEDISMLEDNILWILKEKTIEEEKILSNVYFSNKYLKFINEQEEAMTVYSLFKIVFAPVYGVVSPILFFLLPYLYLYFFSNIKFDFKVYLKICKMSFFGDFNLLGGGEGKTGITRYFSLLISFIIYVQNFLNTVQVSKDTNNIINILHKKVSNVNSFSKKMCELKEVTKEILKFEDIKHCFPKIDCELFEESPKIFNNKGKILKCFNSLLNKNDYEEILNELAKLDYYNSIVILINNSKENICFPSYIENENPIINARKIWHPYLSSPITNDILIGRRNPKNVIITGPNAGGKSTFIKSLALSVIFSQTLGIAFCESMEITPFSIINTYLNIPDCKGKESLFEAEMHRARDHINILKQTDKKDFSFIVMDEIFNSTNPEEGISGAYAIAETLSQFKNSVSIITTHFSYLTNLEQSGHYKNYKIPITRDNDENIIYPYKLKNGVSNQYIALELLRNKGFDDELVNNAESICKNISKTKNIFNKKNINEPDYVKESSTESENENDNENDNDNKNDNENDKDTQINLDILSEPEDNPSDIEFLEESDVEIE